MGLFAISKHHLASVSVHTLSSDKHQEQMEFLWEISILECPRDEKPKRPRDEVSTRENFNMLLQHHLGTKSIQHHRPSRGILRYYIRFWL